MKQSKALKMLSALSQETRVNIYKLLVQEGKEGLGAGMIAEILHVPAATLSFHLTQMTNAGLLKSKKKGRAVMYCAKQKAIKNLSEYLTENSFKKRQKALVEKDNNLPDNGDVDDEVDGD